MSEPASERRVARAIRVFAFPVALSGVVACGAILGIEDRSPIDERADASTDGPSADGATDALLDGIDDGGVIDVVLPDSAGNVCDATTCTGNMRCDGNTCVRICDGGCGGDVICPPGNDCRLECSGGADSCPLVRCISERSCTIVCSGKDACKDGISCEAQTCNFVCENDNCKGGQPLLCDASVCTAQCVHDKSCEKGIDFNAAESHITCNPGACAGKVRCDGPDGSTCSVNCVGTACAKNVCCEATSCSIIPPSKAMCP